MSNASYKQAGVDLEAGYQSVALIKKRLGDLGSSIGGFGGMFPLELAGMQKPILVSGTDGVGTKLKLAFLLDLHHSVGIDCVAMCVNDVVCSGAKPLFFLDYLAVGKNVPSQIDCIVKGVIEGCELAGCKLIGGETAEMPGFYPEGEYDLAGFCVGIVDESKVLDCKRVKKGDVLLGLASSGLHSNGFSLARKVLDSKLLSPFESSKSVAEVLLTPTRIYVKMMLELYEKCEILSVANITGGGFDENIPRSLPQGLGVKIQEGSWEVPPIFDLIAAEGKVPKQDMFKTFNMGIGMTMVVSQGEVQKVLSILESMGERGFVLGEVAEGEGVVLC